MAFRKPWGTLKLQELERIHSGAKEKRFAHDESPQLSQRIKTLESMIDLLLKTLAELNAKELSDFIKALNQTTHHQPSSKIQRELLKMTDVTIIVFLLLQSHGQQSVAMTENVLQKMKRPDLLQRLSDRRSAPGKEPPVEHSSALIHKVATAVAVKELLLETLMDLNQTHLKKLRLFVQLTNFQKGLPLITWRKLLCAGRKELVDLVVRACGQQSVAVIRESLLDLKKDNLAQRLPEDTSGSQEKGSVTERYSALTEKKEMMASVTELLLERLTDLSHTEIKKFKRAVLNQISHDRSAFPWKHVGLADLQHCVFVMVQLYGQQCVERIVEVLDAMKRTDLVQRLSDISSGPKKKLSVAQQHSTLIQKVAVMAAVAQLLLETLNDLTSKELDAFKMFVQSTCQRKLSVIWRLFQTAERVDMVDMMLEEFGQQSVDVTFKALWPVNRTDLVHRFCERLPVYAEGPDLQTPETKPPSLWMRLDELSLNNKKKFMFLLQFTCFQRGLPQIPEQQLDMADTTCARGLVDVIVGELGKQSVEVIWEVLMDMNMAEQVPVFEVYSAVTELKRDWSHAEAVYRGGRREIPWFSPKKEETETTKKLLVEKLNRLSQENFDEFKSFIEPEKASPFISRKHLEAANTQEVVELMVQMHGQQYVEATEDILMVMGRTDLVQRQSGIYAEHEGNRGPIPVVSRQAGKSSVDEELPPLAQRVKAMESVIRMLLETVDGVESRGIKNFRRILLGPLHRRKLYSDVPLWLLGKTDLQNIVFFMVQTYGQQSVGRFKAALQRTGATDLAKRLSGSSSASRNKYLDQHQPLIYKVATMAAVKEQLLETFMHLSYRDMEKFKWFQQFTCCQKSLQYIPVDQLTKTERAEIVSLMMKMCGHKSVEIFRQVFMDINRPDLVPKLSETNVGPKEKYPAEERWLVFSQKRSPMVSVIELLLETLVDLSVGELEEFKLLLSQLQVQRGHSDIPWMLAEITDFRDLAFLIAHTCGQKSVKKTRKVLEKMNKTDLIERMSDSSSGPKKNQPFAYLSALIDKVATITELKDLLFETLHNLSPTDLDRFRWLLQFTCFHWGLPQIPWKQLETADEEEIVDLMMEKCGQQSVEMTREVLVDMNRDDLAHKLPGTTSRSMEKYPPDEHGPALIHRAEMLASDVELILETLMDLSKISEFKHFLSQIHHRTHHSDIPWWLLETTDLQDTAFLMVQAYGTESVQKTKRVLKMMNRTDLVQRLSDRSPKPRKKHSVDECGAALLQRVTVMVAVKQILLETLNNLDHNDRKKFRWLLQFTHFQKGLSKIPCHQLEWAHSTNLLVDLMVERHGQQCLEVAREVFMDMNRTDLVQRLSEACSGSKGIPRSLEPESCESVLQDSSGWIKLDSEFKGTDIDGAPIYSLQSEAGHFECSVSGLRWVCKEKSSFKYQFCSWDGHMERMESMRYIPAGPLMDITVITGKLNEVYLPHWICIEDNPKILDKFAVLHIEDCGDVVEKVSEVTPSHVKLTDPIFSPRAVLMKAGFPVKINCTVLIYQTNTAFLTLHVYLIPRDAGLQQVMDQREVSYGYKVIRKPDPEESLKMYDHFILTTDVEAAEIYPERLKLRYESKRPNFFEMYIKNPDRDFQLKLTPKKDFRAVWTCAVRKDEYESSADKQEKLCAVETLPVLMQKASMTTSDREQLLKVMEHLKQEELKEFKWHLRDRDVGKMLPCIAANRLENADTLDLVDLMLQTYSQQSVEVTKEVFKKINRNDLVEMLS